MKHRKILSAILAASIIGSASAVTVSALAPHGTGVSIRDGWLKNDPDYTFSTDYKHSVWYQNFKALELSGNARTDVLAIALSQLGYHGGPTGDYSGTYSGSNTSDAYKCTEYGRLLVNKYGNNFNENAFDWCACFVNWCLSQAHVDYASGELGCWRWVEELKAMGMFQNAASYGGTYTPRPADMIFFNWDGNNTHSGHIGLVLYTTASRVYTVEGNAGNQVKVRSYALSDPCIIGYGTPPYEEGSRPTADHSYKGGMPAGEYILNASGERMKTTPGGSDTVSGVPAIPLGERVTLIFTTGDYALVRYGGKRGYIPKANLYLLIEYRQNTLSYNANGGVNPPASLTVTEGENCTVSEQIPTLEGSIFLGWSLSPSGSTVDLQAGDTLLLTEDTTLYAVWEEILLPDESQEETTEAECDTDVDTESDTDNSDETGSETVTDRVTETETALSPEETVSRPLMEDTVTPVAAGCTAAASVASLSFLLAGSAALLRRRKD